MITNQTSSARISCIMPVYNEGDRLTNVLDTIADHALIDEVIVINDGSTDNSELILQARADIALITYPRNQGKSHAVMLGLKKAANNIVVMIDSDLLGLTKDNITDLIRPVSEGRADVAMSLRKNTVWVFKVFGLEFWSGDRCFDKRIIDNLDDLDNLPGYGLETFLNTIIVQKKLRLSSVYWDNVIAPRKSEKLGLWAGITGDFRMVGQIIKVSGIWGMLTQFLGMLSLKVR